MDKFLNFIILIIISLFLTSFFRHLFITPIRFINFLVVLKTYQTMIIVVNFLHFPKDQPIIGHQYQFPLLKKTYC